MENTFGDITKGLRWAYGTFTVYNRVDAVVRMLLKRCMFSLKHTAVNKSI